MKVKAITLTGDWAYRIYTGEKTVETRTWSTWHRGWLAICTAKSSPSRPGCPPGHAVAMAWLDDCRPMRKADEPAACCELYLDAQAWHLTRVVKLQKPIPVTGRQRLFTVDVPDDVMAGLDAGPRQETTRADKRNEPAHVRYVRTVEKALRDLGVPYVCVDDAKKAIFAGAHIDNFDLLIYRPAGAHLLAAVLPPSQFRSTPKQEESLRQWQRTFGAGFVGAFIRVGTGEIRGWIMGDEARSQTLAELIAGTAGDNPQPPSKENAPMSRKRISNAPTMPEEAAVAPVDVDDAPPADDPATTGDEQEGQDGQPGPNLGLIDDQTPVGRRFEYDDGDGPRVLVFQQIDDTSDGELRRVILVPDGATGDESFENADGLWPTLAEWNELYSEFVTGYTDPQGETPAGEQTATTPAAAESPANITAPATLSMTEKLMEELRQANEDLHRAADEHETAKDEATNAKKHMERCQEALNDVVDRILAFGNPASLPLFDPANRPTQGGEPGASSEPAALPPAQSSDDAPAAADDSWRQTTLAELTDPDISPRYLRALAENEPPILTLGDLTDWQQAKGDYWAKDLHGMGEKGQEEISDATIAFWQRRKEQQIAALKAAAKAAIDEADAMPNGTAGEDWESLIARIEELLDDDRYQFAADTLTGIRDWVEEHEFATAAQCRAVNNIAASVTD